MEIQEVQRYSQYIGDGIYLIDKAYDEIQYWLITCDGMNIQNKIAVESGMIPTLVRALKQKLEGELKGKRTCTCNAYQLENYGCKCGAK